MSNFESDEDARSKLMFHLLFVTDVTSVTVVHPLTAHSIRTFVDLIQESINCPRLVWMLNSVWTPSS